MGMGAVEDVPSWFSGGSGGSIRARRAGRAGGENRDKAHDQGESIEWLASGKPKI